MGRSVAAVCRRYPWAGRSAILLRCGGSLPCKIASDEVVPDRRVKVAATRFDTSGGGWGQDLGLDTFHHG
jgi:hypothetical protein